MTEGQELDSASFNTNYRVLKETADWLSGQKEPDIDGLVPKVEAAMRAYTICKDRLDKVQATLGQFFEQDGNTDQVTPPRNGDGDEQARKPIRPTPPVVGEDVDLPF